MAGYDGRGARFNIVAVEGNDFAITVTAVDDDAVAVDLSTATITATVYDGTGTALDTLTDSVGGASSNVITLSFTDAEVDALVDPKSWALVVERGGDARTWLAGSFTVADPSRARSSSGTALTATVDSDVNVTVPVNAVGNSSIASDVEITVRNASGSPLTKGTPVYVSGFNVGQDLVQVSPADASSTATMPAIGLVAADIDNNATGTVVALGVLTDFNTSAFSVGDRLYVSETAGQLTATRPTGTAQAQSVGEVIRDNASNGAIDVSLSQTYKTGFAAGLLEDGTAAEARTTLEVLSSAEVASQYGTIATTAPRSALYIPGGTSQYVSCPDSAALDITGDLEIVARVALDDWSPASTQFIVTKFTSAGQRSFGFIINSTPRYQLYWSADGTAIINAISTSNLSRSDGVMYWIKATLDVDNGAGGYSVRFYEAPDSVTEPTVWTQSGSTVTSTPATSIFSSTSTVKIGNESGSSASPTGLFSRVIIRNGIDGTTVADWRGDVPASPYRDSKNNLWTLTGANLGWKLPFG